MGNTNSVNDEWIELKNTTSQNIDLFGWLIKSSDEKIKIHLRGQILANSFYLLERTDDSSVLNTKADIIYKGTLNNNGMDLGLYNSSSIRIDNVNYLSGWPAGDNETKQTAERTTLNNWQTSKDPGGTPREQNSLGATKTAVKISLPEEKSLTEPKKTDIKNNVVFTPIENLPNNDTFLIFLISFLLILISGGILLFLKFKRKT